MVKEMEEAIYVIPLSRVYWGGSRRTRGERALRFIREFIKRHFNAERVILDNMVNEYIFSHKIEKPPRRIVVKVVKIDEKIYKVLLAVAVKRSAKQSQS